MSEKFVSPHDIIECASSWSLDKDVKLLDYLERFSQELIRNAENSNEKLDQLLNNLSETSITFDVARSRFQSLHNTQFIESRVYEEDETTQIDDYDKKDENLEAGEEKSLKAMKNIIKKSTEVIDKYFEKVEVPGSDSEDDTYLPSFTLRPKDPYSEKPLPYIIGTEEWKKTWHVGLLDSSSESEEEKSRRSSVSDSDDSQVPVYSRTSSEVDLQKSHAEEDVKDSYTSSNESEEKSQSYPTVIPTSNSQFAQQLAAKLGEVLDQRIFQEPTVNTKPIQKPFVQKNIILDEPPPLENEDDIFNYKPNSYSTDLFADEDKYSEENQKDGSDKNKKSYITEDNILNRSKADDVENGSQNLFEDDIFATKPVLETRKPILQRNDRRVVPFVDEEPPEINSESAKSIRKPVGGVSVLNNDRIFADKKMQNLLEVQKQKLQDVNKKTVEEKSHDDSEIVSNKIKTQQKAPAKQEVDVPKKDIDIFNDEDNSLFDDDLFSNVNSKTFTSNLFDEISDNESNQIIQSQRKQTDSLEDDKPPSVRNLDMAKDNSVQKPSNNLACLDLFGEVNDDFDDLFSEKPLDKPKVKEENIKEDTARTEKGNLTHTLDNTEDDFFSEKDFLSGVENKLPKNSFDDVEIKKSENFSKPSGIGLFSSTPPDITDDFDFGNLDTNNLDSFFDKLPEVTPQKLVPFSNEPPSIPSHDLLEEVEDLSSLNKEFDTTPKETKESKENNNFEDKGEIANDLGNNITSEKLMDSKNIGKKENIERNIRPGKLKHSLEIDVKALLPNAAIGRRALKIENRQNEKGNELQKNEKEENTTFPFGKQNEQETTNLQNVISEGSPTSFDNIDKTEILKSITKKRAPLPVKRRPSTRKARQESLRKSADDFEQKSSSEIPTDKVQENILENPVILENTSETFQDEEGNRIAGNITDSNQNIHESDNIDILLDPNTDHFESLLKSGTDFENENHPDEGLIYSLTSEKIGHKTRNEHKLFDSSSDSSTFAKYKDNLEESKTQLFESPGEEDPIKTLNFSKSDDGKSKNWSTLFEPQNLDNLEELKDKLFESPKLGNSDDISKGHSELFDPLNTANLEGSKTKLSESENMEKPIKSLTSRKSNNRSKDKLSLFDSSDSDSSTFEEFSGNTSNLFESSNLKSSSNKNSTKNFESKSLDQSAENTSEKSTSKTRNLEKKLFDSSDSDSDLDIIFSSKKANSGGSKILTDAKNEPKYSNKDNTGSVPKNSGSTSILNKTSASSVEKNISKHSLFSDDDDDDDDIFNFKNLSSSTVAPKRKQSEDNNLDSDIKCDSSSTKNKGANKEQSKRTLKSNVKIKENSTVPVMEDPLNLLSQ